MYNTLSGLSTVTNSLKALGLQEDICEDPSKLTDAISELVDDFTEETQDKIEAALSKVDFSTLMYVAVDIFSSAIGGIASEWYDKIINEFFNGKLKGGLTSILSSIMSLIPGAILFFQYSAVSSLRINLEYRIKLFKLLKQDLNFLVQILVSYLTLFEDLDDSYDDLDKAIDELTRAIKVLTIEISKSENSRQIISKDAFLKANTHIEKSIDYLGMGSQKVGQQILDRVHRKYNLKTTPPTITEQFNPAYWVKYFEDLNQEIATSFTGEQGKRTALLIARELFPFFPRFLQLMLLQSRVNQATINLREKTPIITSDRLFNPSINIFGINVNKDIIGDSLKSIYDEALRFFGQEPSKNSRTPLFYRDPKTKDLTLQDLNSRIKVFEEIILSINTMWDFITAAAEPYLNLAKSTADSLIKTRSDMVSFRHDTVNTHLKALDSDDYLAKKLKWISELTLAKGYINTAVGDYSGFQVPTQTRSVRAINGLQVAELLAKSNLIYEDVQQIIINKKFDDNGNIIKEPVEAGFNLSQTSIIKLLGNIAIVATPSKAVDLIAELKSIEFTYNEQYKLDIVEFNKCNSYISLLESSVLFNDIKLSMEYYLNNLKKIPTFSDIIEDLLEGNLGSIVQAIGDTATISDNVLECIGIETPDFAGALKMLDKIADNTFSEILNVVEKSLITIKVELENTTNLILEATNTIKSAEDYVKSIELGANIKDDTTNIPKHAAALAPFIK